MRLDRLYGSADFYNRQIKITELTIGELKEIIRECLREHVKDQAKEASK